MKDIPAMISSAVSQAERALGLDRRFSYARVDAAVSGELAVELSRGEVLEWVLRVVTGVSLESKGTSVSILRFPSGETVRVTLLGAGSETALWATSSVADIRAQASHSTELFTQLIMGETALPLKQEGEWYLVRCADGYHGWVRSWYVTEAARSEIDGYGKRVNVRVEANVAYVLSEPDVHCIPVSEVTAGTMLVGGEVTGAFRRVRMPGGREGYIPARVLGELSRQRASRSRIVERARMFLGVPYIWGGTSAKGFDCSGLVKRVFSMEGFELPRDADRQAAIGRRIPKERLETARPGDLLFFGEGTKATHVAILLEEHRFIHAYGDVRINSYLDGDSLYEEKLAKTLLFASTIVP